MSGTPRAAGPPVVDGNHPRKAGAGITLKFEYHQHQHNIALICFIPAQNFQVLPSRLPRSGTVLSPKLIRPPAADDLDRGPAHPRDAPGGGKGRLRAGRGTLSDPVGV
jgi:hypothetical protein